LVALTGCSAIAAKTNVLDDDKIKSQSAGALGYEPSQLTLVSRRTEGTNTYANLKTSDGKGSSASSTAATCCRWA